MIRINNTKVRNGFSGIINLGEADRLFVSGDGGEYSLFGTVFRVEETGSVIPPSGKDYLDSGSIEKYLSRKIEQRSKLSNDVKRLSSVRDDILDGHYDYGVSKVLINFLSELSFNRIKQLPSFIVGGNLGYTELSKNDEDRNDFETEWETWSNVRPGPKRYNPERTKLTKYGIVEMIETDVFYEKKDPAVSTNHTIEYEPDPYSLIAESVVWSGNEIVPEIETF